MSTIANKEIITTIDTSRDKYSIKGVFSNKSDKIEVEEIIISLTGGDGMISFRSHSDWYDFYHTVKEFNEKARSEGVLNT